MMRGASYPGGAGGQPLEPGKPKLRHPLRLWLTYSQNENGREMKVHRKKGLKKSRPNLAMATMALMKRKGESNRNNGTAWGAVIPTMARNEDVPLRIRYLLSSTWSRRGGSSAIISSLISKFCPGIIPSNLVNSNFSWASFLHSSGSDFLATETPLAIGRRIARAILY